MDLYENNYHRLFALDFYVEKEVINLSIVKSGCASSTILIDVSCSCVCPVIDHEFRHNVVKAAVEVRENEECCESTGRQTGVFQRFSSSPQQETKKTSLEAMEGH